MAERSIEDRQGDLMAMVQGRSDEQITAGVEARGAEKVLGRIFDGMAEAFVPERAAGQDAVIQYHVAVSDTTHSYRLKVANGKCEVLRGTGGPARVTLTMAVPDFLRLVAGELGGMWALMTGKLKVQGDLLFARTMQGWFRQRR